MSHWKFFFCYHLVRVSPVSAAGMPALSVIKSPHIAISAMIHFHLSSERAQAIVSTIIVDADMHGRSY